MPVDRTSQSAVGVTTVIGAVGADGSLSSPSTAVAQFIIDGANLGAARTIQILLNRGTSGAAVMEWNETDGFVLRASPTGAALLTISTDGLTIAGAGGAIAQNDTLTTNFALPGDITPTSLAADADDWAPTGLSGASTVRVAGTAARNITGLTGGADGRILLLCNIGSFNLTLVNGSSSSAAANRFAFVANVVLAPKESCLLQYDSTASLWRCVAAARPAYGTTANTVVQGNDARFAGRLLNRTLFTASAAWAQSDSNATKVLIECIGGGGGGGGAAGNAANSAGGGGGGGGGYSQKLIAIASLASATMTVPDPSAGGLAGNNNGVAGGDVSFGTDCKAKGGSPGIGSAALAVLSAPVAGGAGGVTDVSGDVSLPGMPGGFGEVLAAAIGFGGAGGDAARGGGGAIATVAAGVGANGGNYGGGGAGGLAIGATGRAGGAGAGGCIIVWEYA